MNDKEKEELNRWCHKFMGYCLSRNEDCGCTPRDYTESLDLASIVEAKAIDGTKVTYAAYEDALFDVIAKQHPPNEWKLFNNSYYHFLAVTASAETRCKAARAAVEGEA